MHNEVQRYKAALKACRDGGVDNVDNCAKSIFLSHEIRDFKDIIRKNFKLKMED